VELITKQVETLGCAYPDGQTVRAMRAAGFEVDGFIPEHAVYERKRPDHNIVRRSEVADPDYVFAWVPEGGLIAELTRALDRELLDELLGATRNGRG
jgi:hypothetical protein